MDPWEYGGNASTEALLANLPRPSLQFASRDWSTVLSLRLRNPCPRHSFFPIFLLITIHLELCPSSTPSPNLQPLQQPPQPHSQCLVNDPSAALLRALPLLLRLLSPSRLALPPPTLLLPLLLPPAPILLLRLLVLRALDCSVKWPALLRKHPSPDYLQQLVFGTQCSAGHKTLKAHTKLILRTRMANFFSAVSLSVPQ